MIYCEREDGLMGYLLRNGSALEAKVCIARLNDVSCFLFSLLLLPPQHRNRDIHGSIENLSRPDKAFIFSPMAQWLEILILQGSCNSCSRLAHFTLGRYSGSGHDESFGGRMYDI